MRILMVHPHDIHSSAEPWTRRVKSLAKEFLKKGHEVKLAYFPLSYKQAETHVASGYEAIPLDRASSPPVFIKNIFRLTELAGWADIVHFQKCQHYASIPVVFAAYLKRKPLHYDWDDWEEMIWYESCGKSLHSRFIGFSFKVLERFLPYLSDTVSVASGSLRNLAIRFGVKPENIFPAPVGADVESFHPGLDGNWVKAAYKINGDLVLYIGQLHGAQYIDLFIKTASIVLHRNQNVTFMIVGEGFMEGGLKRLVYDLGIEHKVIFTGSIPHHKIPEYIAAADVCVATFRDTAVTRCKSPLKIVEYMAMGKAIVASNVGEVRNMLGGVGILAKAGDSHALASEILRLLWDKDLRDRLGIFSRLRAEKSYNWTRTASSLLTAYEKHIDKHESNLCDSRRA